MSEWQNTNLSRLANFRNGKGLSSASYLENGKYPVYGSNGEIARTDELLNPGPTIAIGRVGANCGSVYRVDDPSWVTDNAIVATPVDNADFGFLFYKLKSLDLRHTAIGSAQPLITQSGLKEINTTVPPLPEQKAIAHIIGTLDEKIEINHRMNATLEAIAQAIFKSWFVDFDPVRAKAEGRQPSGMDEATAVLFPNGFEESGTELGEVPKGWEIRRLPAIADVIDCLHSRKPKRQEDGPLLLQVYNIGDECCFDMKNKYPISSDEYLSWVRRMEVTEGDLVITKTGRVGAIAQAPRDFRAAMGRNMVGIRVHTGDYGPRFLRGAMLSERMRREITMNTNDGTILKSLHVKAISQLRLVIPRPQLAVAYEKLVAPIHDRVDLNHSENDNLSNLRDTILPKLLSGEVRVGEAEEMVEGV